MKGVTVRGSIRNPKELASLVGRCNVFLYLSLPFCRHLLIKEIKVAKRPGLYANIHAKRKRIKEGSKEKMRKVGAAGAPSKQDFVDSAKTAKKPKKAMYGGTMKRNMKDGGFPDLSGDGKITRKDVLIGSGVDLKGGGNVCKTRKAMSYGGKMKNYASEGKKYGGSANMPNPRKPMGTM